MHEQKICLLEENSEDACFLFQKIVGNKHLAKLQTLILYSGLRERERERGTNLIGEMEDLEVEGGVVSFIREGSELEGVLVSSSSSRRRILILLGIHRYNSQKNSRSVVLPLNQNRSKNNRIIRLVLLLEDKAKKGQHENSREKFRVRVFGCIFHSAEASGKRLTATSSHQKHDFGEKDFAPNRGFLRLGEFCSPNNNNHEGT